MSSNWSKMGFDRSVVSESDCGKGNSSKGTLRIEENAKRKSRF